MRWSVLFSHQRRKSPLLAKNFDHVRSLLHGKSARFLSPPPRRPIAMHCEMAKSLAQRDSSERNRPALIAMRWFAVVLSSSSYLNVGIVRSVARAGDTVRSRSARCYVLLMLIALTVALFAACLLRCRVSVYLLRHCDRLFRL